MRTIIQNRDVAFSKQTRDGAERASKPAVEKHRVLAAKEFRKSPLELAVQIGHSRKHRRSAGAHSMGLERFPGCSNYLGMIRETEIIIRTKIDDRMRLTVVGDGRSGVGWAKHFRFVKWRCPCLLTHPVRETRRSLERVVAFAGSEKIAQAKLEGILVHVLWRIGSLVVYLAIPWSKQRLLASSSCRFIRNRLSNIVFNYLMYGSAGRPNIGPAESSYRGIYCTSGKRNDKS